MELSDKTEELGCDSDTYDVISKGLQVMIRDADDKYKDLPYMPNDYNDTYEELSHVLNHGVFYPPSERTEEQKNFVNKSINGLKEIMDKYTQPLELSHVPNDHKSPGTRSDNGRNGI